MIAQSQELMQGIKKTIYLVSPLYKLDLISFGCKSLNNRRCYASFFSFSVIVQSPELIDGYQTVITIVRLIWCYETSYFVDMKSCFQHLSVNWSISGAGMFHLCNFCNNSICRTDAPNFIKLQILFVAVMNWHFLRFGVNRSICGLLCCIF